MTESQKKAQFALRGLLIGFLLIVCIMAFTVGSGTGNIVATGTPTATASNASSTALPAAQPTTTSQQSRSGGTVIKVRDKSGVVSSLFGCGDSEYITTSLANSYYLPVNLVQTHER